MDAQSYTLTIFMFSRPARLLSEQSDDLSSSFRPLAEFERSRRSHYRQTHSGKLPWEVRGLAGSANERVPEMALEILDKDEGLPEVGPDALDREYTSFNVVRHSAYLVCVQISPSLLLTWKKAWAAPLGRTVRSVARANW